jgi:hypothetical protein
MFEGYKEPDIEAELTRVSIEMQRKLIEKTHQPGEDLSIHAQDWIDHNAGSFRQVFEEIKKETEVVNEWQQHPDEILEKIAHRMDRAA